MLSTATHSWRVTCTEEVFSQQEDVEAEPHETTNRTPTGCALRVVLITAVTLTACGSREPSTDADRLARGRELVEQMSARLAAVQSLSGRAMS